jgi:hypothetical protein
MDYVLREKADAVVATGAKHVNNLADMAFIATFRAT